MTGKAQKTLRSGFTTGTAAAAAAKAALESLFGGRSPKTVRVWLPIGETLEVKVHGTFRVNPHTMVATTDTPIAKGANA